ncbi:MAG TPA: EAL domain-containing protein, partial [Chthoniobacterales bacterium]
PITSPITGQIFFHEALLRLFLPGADAPARAAAFIQRISAAGLSYDVDRFVLQKSCEAMREYPDLILSANLHASSLCNLNLIDTVEQLLASHGIGASRLILEVTETEPISNFEQARTIMTRLRLMGCRFALDDFGAGFSPLRYLKTLPVDLLKIDGFFIHDLSDEPYNQAILRSIQEISHYAGIQTVAEKVENERELAAAVSLGVDYVQGFLLAKPRATPYRPEEIEFAFPAAAALK